MDFDYYPAIRAATPPGATEIEILRGMCSVVSSCLVCWARTDDKEKAVMLLELFVDELYETCSALMNKTPGERRTSTTYDRSIFKPKDGG